MNSYFFYYYNDVPGSIPFFEVVNCQDDSHAFQRCGELLKTRNVSTAQVWMGERLVGSLDRTPSASLGAAQLAANPPQAAASLT